jgi:hypothetical protein
LTCHDQPASPQREDETVNMQPRTTTIVAWGLWPATFGCCAGGLLITLALTRPLTVAVLAEGAVDALTFPLGFATVGLVVSLQRPANPIGWLYAAAGLVWSLAIPGTRGWPSSWPTGLPELRSGPGRLVQVASGPNSR